MDTDIEARIKWRGVAKCTKGDCW